MVLMLREDGELHKLQRKWWFDKGECGAMDSKVNLIIYFMPICCFFIEYIYLFGFSFALNTVHVLNSM